jgi:ZIP family zinc transporter
MSSNFLTILAISLAASVASPIGGLIALWKKPSTLMLSIAVGFAAGVLLATFAFEMLPKALEMGSLPIAVLGFVLGFGLVYGFDLFIHRGVLAGRQAEEQPQARRFYKQHRPRGGEITVLAGGTSAEELIEGLSIGVGAAIEPGLGLLIALAILIDNLSESLSIGEIIRSEGGDRPARRILGWTSLIGGALFASAMAGYFLFQGLPESVLATLFAAGAGGMFYLTVTDLVPEAEDHQYQQSAALATAAGFLVIFVLSNVM